MWKLVLGFLFLGQFVYGQDVKKEAFKILESKCNDCHRIEKKESIFSLENMDMYARKINRQVFIFKVMPKGDEVKLSDKEKASLKTWIKWVKDQK